MNTPTYHAVLSIIADAIQQETNEGITRVSLESECVEFSDGDGDWEVVVRQID